MGGWGEPALRARDDALAGGVGTGCAPCNRLFWQRRVPIPEPAVKSTDIRVLVDKSPPTPLELPEAAPDSNALWATRVQHKPLPQAWGGEDIPVLQSHDSAPRLMQQCTPPRLLFQQSEHGAGTKAVARPAQDMHVIEVDESSTERWQNI